MIVVLINKLLSEYYCRHNNHDLLAPHNMFVDGRKEKDPSFKVKRVMEDVLL